MNGDRNRLAPAGLGRRLWTTANAAQATALAIWCLAAGTTAQTTAPTPTEDGDEGGPRVFSERVDVDVVEVEVFATDAAGHHVIDLGRDDFAVFEDEKPVELTNFLAVAGRRPAASEETGDDGSSAAALPPEQRLNLVLFIDNLGTSPLDRNRVFPLVRQRLPDLVGTDDRVMVVSFDRSLHVDQRFCQDPALVSAALDRIEANAGGSSLIAEKQRTMRALLRAPDSPTQDQRQRIESKDADVPRDEAQNVLRSIHTYAAETAGRTDQMLRALEGFAGSLAALPGRKAVLLVSGGIDLRPGEEMFELWFDRFGYTLGSELGVTSGLSESQRYDQKNALDRLLSSLRASQVVLYGLGVGGNDLGGLAAAEIGAGGERAITAIRGRDPLETLKSLAGESGGLALPARAKGAPVLDRMAEDFASFYSLGFTRPLAADGSEHEIEVRVDRPGVELRYRKSYRVKNIAERAEDRMYTALLHDVTDNPLGVRLELGKAQQEKRDRFMVPVSVRIPLANLLLLPDRDSHAASLALVLAVQDGEGRLSPAKHVDIPIRVPNSRLLTAMTEDYTYQAQLEMRSGEQKLAVAVVDRLTALTSTVNLTVPVG